MHDAPFISVTAELIVGYFWGLKAPPFAPGYELKAAPQPSRDQKHLCWDVTSHPGHGVCIAGIPKDFREFLGLGPELSSHPRFCSMNSLDIFFKLCMPPILFPQFSGFPLLPRTLPTKIPADLGSSAYQWLLEGGLFGRAVRINADFQWWLDFLLRSLVIPLGCNCLFIPRTKRQFCSINHSASWLLMVLSTHFLVCRLPIFEVLCLLTSPANLFLLWNDSKSCRISSFPHRLQVWCAFQILQLLNTS